MPRARGTDIVSIQWQMVGELGSRPALNEDIIELSHYGKLWDAVSQHRPIQRLYFRRWQILSGKKAYAMYAKMLIHYQSPLKLYKLRRHMSKLKNSPTRRESAVFGTLYWDYANEYPACW